tara:strand:- start:197 stop:688 length:492 start_codon:yes stop_codon:yes gene_type:complete
MALSTISVNLIADSSITTAKIADDAITSAKLGLTFTSGSATQDGTVSNTVYDMVTGLTIPAKALIVVSFDFAGKSGENGDPGSNATCAVHITNSSNTPVDSMTGTFMTNENPKTGWRNTTNTLSYFNETGSALTNHKIRAQQYADGDLNSSLVTVKYKIIGLG